MKKATLVTYYCKGNVVDRNGSIHPSVPEKMEIAQDWDGSEYCYIRPLGSDCEGTKTRWQYVTLVFEKTNAD